MKLRGVLIMPENDGEMVRAKHWLIARKKIYRMVYIPIEIDRKVSVIMTEFTAVDEILYRLTFGHHSEKLTAFV